MYVSPFEVEGALGTHADVLARGGGLARRRRLIKPKASW